MMTPLVSEQVRTIAGAEIGELLGGMIDPSLTSRIADGGQLLRCVEELLPLADQLDDVIPEPAGSEPAEEAVEAATVTRPAVGAAEPEDEQDPSLSRLQTEQRQAVQDDKTRVSDRGGS